MNSQKKAIMKEEKLEWIAPVGFRTATNTAEQIIKQKLGFEMKLCTIKLSIK